MWEVERVDGTLYGTSYLIRNKETGGYLADNSSGGGAIHFGTEGKANIACRMLNATDTH